MQWIKKKENLADRFLQNLRRSGEKMARGGREFTHPGIGENRRRNAAAGGSGGGAVHLPFVDAATTDHAGAGAGYLSHGDDGDADATGGLDWERTPRPHKIAWPGETTWLGPCGSVHLTEIKEMVLLIVSFQLTRTAK
jgi:hypothetical protein